MLDNNPTTTDLSSWIGTGYTLVDPLKRFFDDVLMMTDDLDLRAADSDC